MLFDPHAAAVGQMGSGALLVGKGGSGKSTSALGSLASGWRYIGDDYCLLALNGIPQIHSLCTSAKLNAYHLENFPTLLSAISNSKELTSETAILYLHQHERKQ